MLTAIDFFLVSVDGRAAAKTLGSVSSGLQTIGPEGVEWHTRNNPETIHACQDLHQANWANVPKHDVMLASPCCQRHTKARESCRQLSARQLTLDCMGAGAERRGQPAGVRGDRERAGIHGLDSVPGVG